MGENMEMNSSPTRGRLSMSRSVGYLADSAQRETGIVQAASAGDMPRDLPLGGNGEAVSDGCHISSDPGMMTSTSQPAIIRSSNQSPTLCCYMVLCPSCGVSPVIKSLK